MAGSPRMVALTSTSLTLALLTGCPGGKGPATTPVVVTGPVVVESETVLSQVELAAEFGFSADRTVYEHCLYVDRETMTLAAETSPETLEITDRSVRRFLSSGHMEYELDELQDAYEYPIYPADDLMDGQGAIYLLDDRVYGVRNFGSGYEYKVEWVCAKDGDLASIRAQNVVSHDAEITAYESRRHEHRVALKEAGDAEHEAQLDVEAQADLERARTMVSITAAAGGNGPDDGIWITATAQLADGTSMDIRHRMWIFDQLFEYSLVDSPYELLVEVWSKDDPSIRATTGEVAFTFANEKNFECQGAAGANGVDIDYASGGGMFYTGRRGEHGPEVTVEIATTGQRTPDGDQILRYRLTCGDQTEVHTANASARVRVATYGGKGGYGIPQPKGDGTNGGWGGDGGNITLIIDPSVEAYNVVPVTVGGDGGNPSDPDQTNDSTEGERGQPGNPGSVSKQRAAVEIP